MKYTTEKVVKVLQAEKYDLLSEQYVNYENKLLIRCNKGHQYQASWRTFQRGSRCPYCAKKKVNYQQVKQYIRQQGYKLLSKQYVNNKTKLSVQCLNDHQYQVTWSDFKAGYRCPICATNNKKNTFQQIRQYIEQQDYSLLSKKYCNSQSKLLLQCDKGHQYKVRWYAFKVGNRCPRCNQSKGERQLYELLQQAFRDYRVAKQDSLDFLGRLRVDFAIRSLKLAFEYDGKHHFEPVQFGGVSFKKAEKNLELQQQRDLIKEKLLKENGWTLIRIKYDQDIRQQLCAQNIIVDN